MHELLVNCMEKNIEGVFFNWATPENVSRLAPPQKKNLLGLAPP